MNSFNKSTAFTDESVDTIESDVSTSPTQAQRTVDLVPCNFQNTFQNPCFWVLLGIIGTIGVQYLLKKD